MSIKIISFRKEDMKYHYDYRVDRHSPVGNPFVMHGESQRDLVCDDYENYFEEQMSVKYSPFTHYLNNLVVVYRVTGKLRLFCWCAPLRCHAETIRNYILERVGDITNIK